MRFATLRRLEDEHGIRVGLHFFRFGAHLKVQRDVDYRHLVVKIGRGSAFGKAKKRHQIWIGWWESRKGERRDLNGFRFVIALDKLPPRPPESTVIPFFPQNPRRRIAS